MKWTYKVVEAATPHDLTIMLREPGIEGWELVTVMPHTYVKKNLVAYLKRQVDD